MSRRKGSSRADAAFEGVSERIETAKEALVAAIPSPRGHVRVSLAEALLAFETELAEARRAMPGWRRPETGGLWTRCVEALDRAATRAERLRLDAPPLDYESLVATIDDLMAPLEAFGEANDALRQAPGASTRRRP